MITFIYCQVKSLGWVWYSLEWKDKKNESLDLSWALSDLYQPIPSSIRPFQNSINLTLDDYFNEWNEEMKHQSLDLSQALSDLSQALSNISGDLSNLITDWMKIQQESRSVTQIYSSTPYSPFRWCYMVVKGTNRKLILIQVAPLERFGWFSSVHEIQLLKGSKFAILKSGEKSLI